MPRSGLGVLLVWRSLVLPWRLPLLQSAPITSTFLPKSRPTICPAHSSFCAHPGPNGQNYQATITDPLGDVEYGYSYAAALDTGSSGSVICRTEADGRGIFAVTGQDYQDQGIGGPETFGTSPLVTVKLAAVDSGAVVISSDGTSVTEHTDMFAPAGDNKLQIRVSDPDIDVGYGMTTTVMVNTIGTPVLNQAVMHVKSGSNNFFPYQMDSWGFVPVNYVPTELVSQSLLPGNINTGNSQLVLVPENTRVAPFHVPLTYQNFVDYGLNPHPAPSVSTNPTIPGVTIDVGSQSVTSTWLLDSGAAVTMMGRDLAESLGINIDGPGVTSTSVLGIGGTITFQGYNVDEIVLPAAGGRSVTFHDLVIFVPNEGDLPADLPGIFGMNLIDNSFSGLTSDLFDIIETDPVASLFSDWYVIPGSPTTIPEPGTFVLAAIGATLLLLRRFVRPCQ